MDVKERGRMKLKEKIRQAIAFGRAHQLSDDDIVTCIGTAILQKGLKTRCP